MKKLIIYIFILLNFASFSQELSHQIIVKGEVLYENKKPADCKIEVFENTKKINETYANSGSFRLVLDKGEEVILKFSEKDYVSKKVLVSTIGISDDDIDYGIFALNIPMELFSDFEGLDKKDLEQAVAKIYFDEKIGDFTNNEDYYSKMKPKVDALKEKMHQLKDAAYNKAVAEGDNNFNKKQYEDAWLNYVTALDIYRFKKYPQDQIDAIRKILLKDISELEAYKKAIKKADLKFEAKKWEKALKAYKKALLYKPNDNYALSRIDDILTILNFLKENPNYTNNKGEIASNIIKTDNKNQTYSDKKNSIEKIKNEIKEPSDSIKNAQNYFDKGMLEYEIGEFDDAITSMEKAAIIYSNIGEKEAEAEINSDIGTIYDNIYNYNKAEEYYSKANKLYSGINKKDKMAELYTNLGNINFNQGNYHKAIGLYEKSKDIYTEINDRKNIGNSYNYIGVSYFELEDYKNSLDNFNKSISISGPNKYMREYAMSLNNVGNINYEQNQMKSALDFYNKSIKVKKDIEFWKGVAVSLHNIGNVYKKQGKNEKALEYFKQSNKIAESTNFKQIKVKNYAAMADLYALIEQCQESLKYFKLYAESKHLLDDQRLNNQISETNNTYVNKYQEGNEQISILKQQISKQKLLMQLQNKEKLREIALLNKDKKLKELKLKEQDAKVERQRLFIIIGLGLFIIFWIFLILLLRQIKQKRKINNKLLDNQNQITDSLYYAKRIQKAVFPPLEIFDSEFKNYFILNKPRDIVGGDFYWINKKLDKIAIAVGDCTGHGVPGGFLSMISVTFLNEIVNKSYSLNPATTLDELKKSIIKSLHQGEENSENKDGLDIALCVINKTTKTINFAGAYNPLIIVSKNYDKINNNEALVTNNEYKLFELKADKMPISVYYKSEKNYKNTSVNYKSGDRIYLFSDGYIDQFGGKKNKRFMKKNFYKLIIDNQNLNMLEQNKIIYDAYKAWKNSNEQIDDILVMGIELE